MRTVILGDGGHAKVLASLLSKPEMIGKDVPVPKGVDLVIGVGDVGTRKALYEQYEDRVISVIWNFSSFPFFVVKGSSFWPGLQVMAGVIIQPGCSIGRNVLINTGAQIDHDCTIGDHSVIGPGAILCGTVTLGEACCVGAGAVITQNVTLDAGTFVKAGSVVSN